MRSLHDGAVEQVVLPIADLAVVQRTVTKGEVRLFDRLQFLFGTALGGHARRLLLHDLAHFQQRFHLAVVGYLHHQRFVFAQQRMLFHPVAAAPREEMMPLTSSTPSASRTGTRLTPNASANTFSDGSFSPTGKVPSLMPAFSCAST